MGLSGFGCLLKIRNTTSTALVVASPGRPSTTWRKRLRRRAPGRFLRGAGGVRGKPLVPSDGVKKREVLQRQRIKTRGRAIAAKPRDRRRHAMIE